MENRDDNRQLAMNYVPIQIELQQFLLTDAGPINQDEIVSKDVRIDTSSSPSVYIENQKPDYKKNSR